MVDDARSARERVGLRVVLLVGLQLDGEVGALGMDRGASRKRNAVVVQLRVQREERGALQELVAGCRRDRAALDGDVRGGEGRQARRRPQCGLVCLVVDEQEDELPAGVARR